MLLVNQLKAQILRYADREGFWLLLIGFLSLLLRLLYFLQSNENPFLYVPLVDEEYYVEYAKSILSSSSENAYTGFHMDPLYGYFLAAIYYVFDGELLPARFLQIFFDCATAILLFFIGKRLWMQKIGAIAGIFYAIYPVAWFYDLALLKTSLTTFFLVSYSWVLIRTIEPTDNKPIIWHWTAVGVAAAVGVYLRGYLIFLPVFTPLFIAYYYGFKNVQSYSRITAYFVGVAVIFISVGAMNWTNSGQFMLLPGNSGITLYSANNPQNPQGAYSKPDFVNDNHPAHLYQQYKNEAERLSQRSLTRQEVSDFWTRKSVAYWFSSPNVLPNLVMNRLAHFVSHNEIANNLSYRQAARFSPMLLPQVPAFSIALALGLPGLCLAVMRSKKSATLLVGLFVVLSTCLLFYASSRFRFPALPIFLLGAAYFVFFVAANYKKRAGLFAIVGALILFVLSIASDGVKLDERLGELNLAIAYTKLGKSDKALQVLEGIALTDPAASQNSMHIFSKYYQVKGYAHLAAKQYEEALFSGEQVIQVNPSDLIALNNAGIAALHIGRSQRAVELLAKACELQQSGENYYWYAKALFENGQRDKAREILNKALNLGDSSQEIRTEINRLLEELP